MDTLTCYEFLHQTQQHSHVVHAISIDSLHERIFTAGRDAMVAAWNQHDGSQLWANRLHSHWVTGLCKLDKQILVTSSCDQTVRIWNSENGECIQCIKPHEDYIECIIDIDDTKVATGGLDRLILSIDVETLKKERIGIAGSSIYSMDNAPEAGFLAAGLANGHVGIIDPREKHKQSIIHADRYEIVRAVSLTDDGTFLWSAGDNCVKLWDMRVREVVKTEETGRVWNMKAYDETGVVVGCDGYLMMIDREKEPETYHLDTFEGDRITSLDVDCKSGEIWYGDECSNVLRFCQDKSELVIPGIERLTKAEVSHNSAVVTLENLSGTRIDFDLLRSEECNSCDAYQSASRWFSIDIKLGFLAITLSDPLCFQGNVYIERDELCNYIPWENVPEETWSRSSSGVNYSEISVNYGEIRLRRMFSAWLADSVGDEDSSAGFTSDTKLLMQDGSTRDISDMSVEEMDAILPEWAKNAIEARKFYVKDVKTKFEMIPHPDSILNPISKSRKYSAADTITLRRLIVFVVNLVQIPINQDVGVDMSKLFEFKTMIQRLRSGEPVVEEGYPSPEEVLEIWYDGRPVDSRLSLRTVKDLFGSSSKQSMILHYKLADE